MTQHHDTPRRRPDAIDFFAAALILLGLALLLADALGAGAAVAAVLAGGIGNWAPGMVLDGMLLGVVNRILRSQERTRVLSQVSSLSREFALDATRRARDEGWLHDGTLNGRRLSRASLRGADMAEAALRGVDFTFSNLREAALPYADLRRADLTGADLREADLRWADLSGATLRWADLRGALLEGARLEGVDGAYAAVDPQHARLPAFQAAIPGGFLDRTQVGEIRRTFHLFEDLGKEAGIRFYERLFEEAPATRAMFRADPAAQGRKFMHMLGVVVSALHTPTRHVAVLQSLGERHRGYGVVPEHYALVGRVLMQVLEESLGDEFTEDARSAWGRAFELITVLMGGAPRPATAGELQPR